MWWLPYLLGIGAAGVGARSLWQRRRRTATELAGRLRLGRSACESDVTTYGERLAELHVDTLTTPLDEAMRTSYQSALDCYETAKQRLRDTRSPDDVEAVTETLAEGRYHVACVMADRDGAARPDRRPPCFFDPAHGPSSRDVEWAPPGGVARTVPVSFRDAQRLEEGETPDVRLLLWGGMRVPWWRTGAAYGPWADGYYRAAVERDLMPGFVLGAGVVPVWSDGASGGWHGFAGAGVADLSGGAPTSYDGYLGGFDGGGHGGYGGHGGHGGFDGGGHDGGGGFDGGGFDGGGGGDGG